MSAAYLYVLARAGKPIYVGCTTQIGQRLCTHRIKNYDAYWYQSIDLDEMLGAEAKLIKRLRPVLNVVHNNPFPYVPTPERSHVIYPLRIEPSLLAAIADLAQQRGRSMAYIIREALSEYLNRSTA